MADRKGISALSSLLCKFCLSAYLTTFHERHQVSLSYVGKIINVHSQLLLGSFTENRFYCLSHTHPLLSPHFSQNNHDHGTVII